MKKVIEKVIFMAVGSLLTIIGCHFGTVGSNMYLNAAEDNNEIITDGVTSIPASAFVDHVYSVTIESEWKKRTPVEKTIIIMQDEIIKTLKKEFKLNDSVIAQMKLGVIEVLNADRKLDKLAIIQVQLGVIKALQEHQKLDGSTIIQILQNITKVLEAKPKLESANIPQLQKDIVNFLRTGLTNKMLSDWPSGKLGITLSTAFQAVSERINYLQTKLEPAESAIIEMQQDIIKALNEQFNLDDSTIGKMLVDVSNAAEALLKEDKPLDNLAVTRMQDDIIKALNEQFKLDNATIKQMKDEIDDALRERVEIDKSTIPQLQNDIIEVLRKGLKENHLVE